MAERLWNYFDGEPYLTNPRLFIVNPAKRRKSRKKGVKVMARRRRRMTAKQLKYFGPRRGRKRSPARRRRRTYRRNTPLLALPNPRRRRRTHARHTRRRSYRRNPVSFAGLNLTDMLYTGGAVLAAPFIERQIAPLLPASMAGTTAGRWGVKIGSAAATWYAWKTIFGKKYGDLAAVVLGANLVSDAAQEFMPSFTAGIHGVGTYTSHLSGMGTYTNLLSGNPRNLVGMGRVTSGPVAQMGNVVPNGGRFSGRFGSRMLRGR